MQEDKVKISELFDELSKKYDVKNQKSYEVIYPENYEIKTLGNKYVKLIAVSRHKTSKHLMKVIVEVEKHQEDSNEMKDSALFRRCEDVTVTTEHICMRYDKDHFFENVAAEHLRVNDYVSVYDEVDDKEIVGIVIGIKYLSKN